MKANDATRRDILAQLESSGPLAMRALPDTCVKPWESTGWTGTRNVEKLLDFMVARGEVAGAGRQGRERRWDLAALPTHRVWHHQARCWGRGVGGVR